MADATEWLDVRRGQVVEPKLLMNGAHDILRCQSATEDVLHSVFEQLNAQGCLLDGMVLKPSIVTSGNKDPIQADSAQEAELTLKTLSRCVPAAVRRVAFLSGGLPGEEACKNLSAMTFEEPHPWELPFSFRRALQIWVGEPGKVVPAQAAFLHRARMSSIGR